MIRPITRRDFLDGVVIGTGLGLMSPAGLFAAATPATRSNPTALYPPVLTGLRGSHEGSFEVAHALAWRGEKPEAYAETGEHYDLVVVGAGMSGLAAAWFYRKKMGPQARILLLDNHDDFGGHAKRNEFHHNGRMVLSLGGAQNLENPGSYSKTAKRLLSDIGITPDFLDAMATNTPDDLVLGGNLMADRTVSMPDGQGRRINISGEWQRYYLGDGDYESAIRKLPLATEEQDTLIAFLGGGRDFLDDLSLSEMYDYLNTVSYNRFLTERVGLSPNTVSLLDGILRAVGGYTGWNYTVAEAFAYGAPGLRAIGRLGRMAGSLAASMADSAIEIRMFPDGNASVARLLVHKLIPSVAPAMKGVEDVATAQFNYAALDRESHNTRLRLNSTAVGVREIDGERVQVDYVKQGQALRVTGSHCILACYNGLIPHLCPELPEIQKEALSYGVKTPFVYANVLLRDGRAFAQLNTTLIECPLDPFSWISSAPTMTTAGYSPPRGPDDPMAVFMMSAPTPAPQGNETARDLSRLGRHSIYSTPFADYERDIRAQLQAVLGPYGFNHEADIQAITVNRLPHGYAYEYLTLYDFTWPEGEAPNVVGRARFGRISIANSDSEARAYMDSAWDAAWRAVEEQTA